MPLNDLDEVGRLYEAADFFKLKKDDVMVPFVVVGGSVLAGEAAVQRDLDGQDPDRHRGRRLERPGAAGRAWPNWPPGPRPRRAPRSPR